MRRTVPLRVRIVIIFGLAALTMMAAVAVPLSVVQDYTQATLSEQRQNLLGLAWFNALTDHAKPYQVLAARLMLDPALAAAMAQGDPAAVSRALRTAGQPWPGGDQALQRLDVITADGRLVASSAGLAAEAPMVNTRGSGARTVQSRWVVSVEDDPTGALFLVVTSAMPNGNLLAVSTALEPALRAFDEAGAGTALRSVFLIGHHSELLHATDPTAWPAVAAAHAKDGSFPLVLERDGHILDAVSAPLLNLAGTQVATLMVLSDATAASQRRSLILLLTGSAAAAVFAALLLGLYGFARVALEPLAEMARVIRAMAAGDAMAVADLPERRDEVGALARAVEVFRRDILALARVRIADTLRRAQQQALIRQEMQSLSAVLEEAERESLLAELQTIEATGGEQDGTALAAAFRQMAARVTAQHARLADLLAQRTRDLDVVRDALTERAQLFRLREELDVARRLQMGSLPAVFPPFPERTEFDLFAAMVPAKEVGGDFYDFALLGDRLVLMIGDASGKGVSGAIFVATTRVLLRSAMVHGASPAQALATANVTLAVDNPTMMFTTAFIAVLDLATGLLTYANAGHNPPYLSAPGSASSGGLQTLAGSDGIALGVLDEAEYEDATLHVAAGASLVLFTDGVTEANRPDYALYGETRLEDVLQGLELESPEDLVAGIQDAVQRFADGEEQADDITVLVARFRGPTGGTNAGVSPLTGMFQK